MGSMAASKRVESSNDGLIQRQPFRRQQVLLPWMAWRVGEKKTDKAILYGWVEVVFQKVLSVLQPFEFHHLFDTQFFGSDNSYKLNDAFIAREHLTIWI